MIRYNAEDAPQKQAAFPQYEYPQAKERYARIATYLGLPGKDDAEKVTSLIAAIEELKTRLNLPSTIREAGVDEAKFRGDVEKLAELAFDDQCTGANPRYPLIMDVRDMYLKAFDQRAE